MRYWALHTVFVDGDSWSHPTFLSGHLTKEGAVAAAHAHAERNPTKSISYSRNPGANRREILFTESLSDSSDVEGYDYVISEEEMRH